MLDKGNERNKERERRELLGRRGVLQYGDALVDRGRGWRGFRVAGWLGWKLAGWLVSGWLAGWVSG